MSEDPSVYGLSIQAEAENRAYCQLRRHIRRVEIGAAVLFVIVLAAGIGQLRRARAERAETRARIEQVVEQHNALVETLNKRLGGAGAVLEGLGVPGGRILGDLIDEVLPPSKTDRRRR